MTTSMRTTTGVLNAHRNAGAAFTAGGIRSFLRTEGDGEPVVCIHGMLGSSFGYGNFCANSPRGGSAGSPGMSPASGWQTALRRTTTAGRASVFFARTCGMSTVQDHSGGPGIIEVK